ncbi:IS66 family transposase [Aeoliella mucimassa]|uniref:Transposase IS66 family protein n=1 Tax=Aeoliella mucimassa TaxID=2527972 RepID=A0A518AIR6_9BACT|nr:IS66 family transposase [Aeoliella mucimassa]QDU54629.1 Transposase IS66 family protein [Aeoliella mucimassa]
MTVITDELPNDVAALKQLILKERREREAEAERFEAQKQAAIEEAVKAAVAAILRRYYGPRSEKFDPRQLLLCGQQLDDAKLNQSSIEDESGEELVTRRIKNRDKHGRQQLPEHLERIEIEHDLDSKACPACGNERCRIGAEISEQLEYFPASFKVLKHIRHKYACAKCDHDGYDPNIAVAAKPPQPIEKGLPGPSLLAHVITSKLGDHLPLYRLERIFERQKVHVARSTMCAWMRCAGELVTPLVELMTERVRQSQVIHTDDTTVPIQSPGAKQCRKGRIWCYLGDEQNPYKVYDYTPSRSRDGPAKWLTGYEGYLQADAYGGYDGMFHSQNVTEVACWAHARRKFYDAQDSDEERATQMLALIAKLYAVEREAKESDDDARLALRQERSMPVLERIKLWLDAEEEVVLPRSPMATAITYAQNQWTALNTYTTQGFLNIDNNASERALKRVALGRKNWLFAGNDAAAENHARLWSLIASCERHGIDPQRYLTSVLAKIGTTSHDELDQFLPDVWKVEDATEILEPAVGGALPSPSMDAIANIADVLRQSGKPIIDRNVVVGASP